MKIAVDLTELYDNFSGIERYACCQTKQLIRDYPENGYLLFFKNEIHETLREETEQPNVTAVVLKGKGKLFFSQFTLPAAMKKYRYDAALFLSYPAPYFLKHPEKAVSAIHDMCVYDFPATMTFKSRMFFRTLFRRAVKKDRAIVTVSHFSESRIRHYYKKDPKIIVAESGVDHILRVAGKDAAPSGTFDLPAQYILSLCTLEPRKNLGLLISAFTELHSRFPECDLVLAGRKGWKIDGLLKDLPQEIASKIVCTGFVKDGDLPTLYRNASCFAFPSEYEGFGLPPLEALALGGLVVSSDAASMPEILGKGAIYFRSGDKDDLIKKLAFALGEIDEETRCALIAAGKERADGYTWKHSAKKLMEGLWKE